MNTLTFVVVLYVLIGVGTGIFAAFNGEENRRARVIGWPLIWPLVWFMVIYVYLSGQNPSKCAWCGKVVGSWHEKDRDLWRKHYLDECEEHPLTLKTKRLERYLDETDRRYTDLRVTIAELNKLFESVTWKQIDNEYSDTWMCTGCGTESVWEECSPEEGGLKFCSFCGRPVKFERYINPSEGE